MNRRFSFLSSLIVGSLLWGSVAADDRSDQHLEEFLATAIKAYREQNYEEALKSLEKASEIDPNDASIAILRNEIALALSAKKQNEGDFEQARDYASKVLGNPLGGLSTKAQYLLNAMDVRPEEGFHGYLSADFSYDTNVASSVDPGNTVPTDTPGFGSTSVILLGYQGRIASRYYWDVWVEALPQFWQGQAENLDWQQYNSGLLLGAKADRWDFSLAYKFSADVFDSELNRLRHGVETTASYWAISNRWQTGLKGNVSFDDFRLIDQADATYYKVSWFNYLPFYLENPGRYGYVFGGYSYIANNASSIYGYQGHQVNLSLYVPTSLWSLGIQFDGSLERRSYDVPNPTDRRDTIGLAYAGVVRDWTLPEFLKVKNLNNSIQTRIGYTYIETQSSVSFFNKVEHLATLTVSYQF